MVPEAELAFKVTGQDEVTSVGVRQCRQREESGQGLSLQPPVRAGQGAEEEQRETGEERPS